MENKFNWKTSLVSAATFALLTAVFGLGWAFVLMVVGTIIFFIGLHLGSKDSEQLEEPD